MEIGIFLKIGKFLGWNRKFLRADSRPPDFETDWRRCRAAPKDDTIIPSPRTLEKAANDRSSPKC